MQPALRRTVPTPLRFVFVFSPNGKKMDEWRPAPGDGELVLPYLLEPLTDLRQHLLVLGNLTLDGARAHGDGPGDHARAAGAFLTCAHPKKTGGADIHCGVSIDQELAALGQGATRLPSLELGLEPGRAAGVCDSGYSCAYSNNISWKTPTMPMVKETNPRGAFERVFGVDLSSQGAKEREAARPGRQSVLDAVRDDARRLAQTLGAGDRDKLTEYLDAVREVERGLQAASTAPSAMPEGLTSTGLDYRARLRLMYQIIALALQGDATRVVTLMLGNAGSNRSYPFLEVPEGHHDLSHHGGQAQKLQQIRRINRFQIEEFATFGQQLAAPREGGGSLLDACAVTYGSGIADGNSHAHHDLPILLLGGANGRVRGGRALRPSRQTPLANLYLGYLQWSGAERDVFADSTGTLAV